MHTGISRGGFNETAITRGDGYPHNRRRLVGVERRRRANPGRREGASRDEDLHGAAHGGWATGSARRLGLPQRDAARAPAQFADKAFLTDKEVADYEEEIAGLRNQDRRDQDARGKVNGEETTGDVARAYNDFWWDFGKKVVGDATHLADYRSAGREDSRVDAIGEEAGRPSGQSYVSASRSGRKTAASASAASWGSTPARR